MRRWRWYLTFGLPAATGLLVAVLFLRPSVPGRTILELRLDRTVVDYVPGETLARLLVGKTPLLRDVVGALDRAAADDRVVGLVATLGNAPMMPATAQELRDAVGRFRKKGKFAVAFAETFGEFGAANTAYYLATGFDEIRLQPSGDVGLTGLYLESPFLKGTLDKLGVRFQGDRRWEYKNAFNTFTETKFTPAHREALDAVKRSLFGQMVRGIAAARKLDEATVRGLVDRGPLLGEEALRARLVDGLSYRDEVYEAVKKRGGDGARLLYLERYLERAGQPHRSGKTIALVYGVGAVSRGKSRVSPLSGAVTMGSETVAKALRDAVKDAEVKAILFRVNSPGGSYVASDTIWREVQRARKAGKPVVVSMGDVAGSGGYFVAMGADKIVAQPGTITGSIGVLAGKPVLAGLYEKVGLSFDHVQSGAHAGFFSTGRAFTPDEMVRLGSWLDRIYADFTGKVAKGRKLSPARVHEIARGRIWTGEDAKRLGLVDALGGMETALALAKSAAGIGAEEKVRVRLFPRPHRSRLEDYLEMMRPDTPDNSEEPAAVALWREAVRVLAPLVRTVERFPGAPGEQVLASPELRIR